MKNGLLINNINDNNNEIGIKSLFPCIVDTSETAIVGSKKIGDIILKINNNIISIIKMILRLNCLICIHIYYKNFRN
jgi:hypothetical protein